VLLSVSDLPNAALIALFWSTCRSFKIVSSFLPVHRILDGSMKTSMAYWSSDVVDIGVMTLSMICLGRWCDSLLMRQTLLDNSIFKLSACFVHVQLLEIFTLSSSSA
jgi:hypothetical protein